MSGRRRGCEGAACPANALKSIVDAAWDPKASGGLNQIHPGLQVSLTSRLIAWQSALIVHPAAPPGAAGERLARHRASCSPGHPHWAATSENPQCPSTGLRLHLFLNSATGTPERRVPAAKPLLFLSPCLAVPIAAWDLPGHPSGPVGLQADLVPATAEGPRPERPGGVNEGTAERRMTPGLVCGCNPAFFLLPTITDCV